MAASFMAAVEAGADWNLTARVDGSVVETTKARELLREIAEGRALLGDDRSGIEAFDAGEHL